MYYRLPSSSFASAGRPFASHIGPFARSLSKQGYSLYSIHHQVRLAAAFSRWLHSGSGIIQCHLRSSAAVFDIALGMHNQVRAMCLARETAQVSALLKASFPPSRSQHPD